MAEPLTLTFGVELEFILTFNWEDHEVDMAHIFDMCDPHARQIDGHYSKDYLQYMDLRARKESASDDFFHALSGKGFPVSRTPDLNAWNIARDHSIETPRSGSDDFGYGYVGIELKSPALPYTTESLVEIRRMCRHLETFHILINESCGLHVHVGNERKGFPVETMKNLCILAVTFERELESIHPPHRMSNFYTRSIGSVFDNGISLPEIRRMIRDAETAGDLIKLVQKGVKQHAYNFLNLQSSKDQTSKKQSSKGLKTIEFRQHEATINADAITRWVELTCGLVNKAHQIAVQGPLNVGEMDAYIDRMNSIPHLSIIEIAKSLGLEDVASYYEGRGLHTHPRALRSRAGSNNARTVTQLGRPENAITPSVRPNNAVFLDGQQTVRTFMTSTDSRQRYEQAVEGYDAENLIRDPRGIEFGVAGSEERAQDSHDDFDPASTKVQFFSWSMPVERLSTPQPNGAMTRNMSSTLPIMTRSLPTRTEKSLLICKDLFGRRVSAPDMASYSALSSPIRKTGPPVSFNPRAATLAARSRGISALPLRLIYALGYIPTLGSLSRAVKPTWSASTIAPESRDSWTASTSDW
ncbi:putative amidoligase enzyme-domain-containing protein [Usnea florida]